MADSLGQALLALHFGADPGDVGDDGLPLAKIQRDESTEVEKTSEEESTERYESTDLQNVIRNVNILSNRVEDVMKNNRKVGEIFTMSFFDSSGILVKEITEEEDFCSSTFTITTTDYPKMDMEVIEKTNHPKKDMEVIEKFDIKFPSEMNAFSPFWLENMTVKKFVKTPSNDWDKYTITTTEIEDDRGKLIMRIQQTDTSMRQTEYIRDKYNDQNEVEERFLVTMEPISYKSVDATRVKDGHGSVFEVKEQRGRYIGDFFVTTVKRDYETNDLISREATEKTFTYYPKDDTLEVKEKFETDHQATQTTTYIDYKKSTKRVEQITTTHHGEYLPIVMETTPNLFIHRREIYTNYFKLNPQTNQSELHNDIGAALVQEVRDEVPTSEDYEKIQRFYLNGRMHDPKNVSEIVTQEVELQNGEHKVYVRRTWYMNDVKSRHDGPAVEIYDFTHDPENPEKISQQWWYRGTQYDNEEIFDTRLTLDGYYGTMPVFFEEDQVNLVDGLNEDGLYSQKPDGTEFTEEQARALARETWNENVKKYKVWFEKLYDDAVEKFGKDVFPKREVENPDYDKQIGKKSSDAQEAERV